MGCIIRRFKVLDISWLRYQGRSLLDLESQVSGTLPPTRTWARLANYASPPDLTVFSFFLFFFHPSLPAWLSVRVSVCALRSISWSGQHSKCRDLSHLRTENLANWGLLKFSPGQSHSIDIYNAIVEPNPNRPWTGTLLQISPRFAVSAIAPVPSEFTMATGMIWACTPSRLYYTLSEVMI